MGLHVCQLWLFCNSQAQHERELGVMKIELLDMKKQRVKMMNKMRSEASECCRSTLSLNDIHSPHMILIVLKFCHVEMSGY